MLGRFSGVALVAVAVAILTGVFRSIGELSDPAELWQTDYGRSILYKVALLVPIARGRPLQPADRGGAAPGAAAQRPDAARWCGAPRAPSWRCRW